MGHTLVVPKRHRENTFEISEKELAHSSKVVKKVASAVKKAANVEGVKIVQNNGEAAGQMISHLHVHIILMHAELSSLHNREIREAIVLEGDAKKIRRFL